MVMMIKWIFQEWDGREWQGKDKWQALVSIVIKTSGSIKYREFVDWLRNYQPFKNNSAPLSLLFTSVNATTSCCALFFAVSTFLPNKLTSAAKRFLRCAIQFKPFFKQHTLEKNNEANTTSWFTLTVVWNAFNICSHYWTHISNTCTLINLISFS